MGHVRHHSLDVRDVVVLALIGVASAALAFSVLGAGRPLVVEYGRRVIRQELVRESDRVASLPDAEVYREAGCRRAAGQPFPHRACVEVNASGDSLRIAVTVVPDNRLVSADSVVFEVSVQSQ